MRRRHRPRREADHELEAAALVLRVRAEVVVEVAPPLLLAASAHATDELVDGRGARVHARLERLARDEERERGEEDPVHAR